MILFGCAEVGAPPGGEEDKIKPTVVAAVPANGATSVPRDNKIRIDFSERIVPPRTGSGIFVSPRPVQAPEVHWKATSVEIVFADSFSVDQTYVINLSSDVRDLRNNPIDTGSSIAFSTGEMIDSGRLSGRVTSDSRNLGGIVVALFDPARLGDSLLFDSIYPAYMTQTSPEGRFSLGYLPARKFFLLAFDDKDLNRFFEPNQELFGLPDRPAVLGGQFDLDSLYLPMTRYDSVGQAIALASFESSGMLKIRLREEIDVQPLAVDLSRIILKRLEDSSFTISPAALVEAYEERGRELNLFIPFASPGHYNLSLQLGLDSYSYDSLFLDSARDLKKPEIVSVSPGSLPILMRDFRLTLYFSEPIDTSKLTEGTFTVWGDSTTQLSSNLMQVSPLEIEVKPQGLVEGKAYKLSVAEFEIADLSGNLLGDSLTEYNFSILDRDSLGTASGTVHSALAAAGSSILVEFKNYANGAVHAQKVSDDRFTFNLPAGKYQLSGFIDTDEDGRRSRGRLYPFAYSETFSVFPDTIKVRARFETAEIDFEIK